MMSDLLASDNINLHNRVGKRDHAHATLAPPHHESQRTRDQRKGPPDPTGPDVSSESGFSHLPCHRLALLTVKLTLIMQLHAC